MPRSFSKPHSASHRLERVGELIRHAIAEILARGEVRDDALDRHPLTVPAVRMSPDLKLATVLVMPLGGQGAGATVEALEPPQEGAARARRASRQSQVRSRSALCPRYELRRAGAHGRAPEIAGGGARPQEPRRRGPRMTDDGRDGGLSGPEARARRAASLGRSARPGSRSTAGSTSTSRPASPRPRPSDGSSSCSTPRRRATPARSTRSPRACCRSLSARRPRPCRSYRTAPRPTAFACAGARKARPTTPKGRSSRAPTGAPLQPRSKPSCPRFVGVILQTPPTFSAIRIDGARAYDLAREGESFEIRTAPDQRLPARPDFSRSRMPRCSRPNAARAPMCARSRAISAARSAATAM